MSILKYKDSQGNWVSADFFNQVISVENSQEWKEIEVFADANGEFDCSAAGIDLLDTENWVLCASGINVNDSNNSSFHAVAANKPQALFITPIIARLKGADMSDVWQRIGVYTLNVDAYGYKGFGSDMFVHKANAPAMEPGVTSVQTYRVYSTYIITPGTLQGSAKLIFLGNKED